MSAQVICLAKERKKRTKTPITVACDFAAALTLLHLECLTVAAKLTTSALYPNGIDDDRG